MQKDLFKKFNTKAQSGDERAIAMMDLRNDLIQHFNKNIDPKDAAALTEARGQWKAYKALDAGLRKSEAGIAQRSPGVVTPNDLSRGVSSTYSNPARTPFGDLPQIGQQFLRDTTAQTGGSPRAFLQNNATTLGIGALGGLGWAANPWLAATGAAAFLGGNKLLTSPLVRQAVQNPASIQRLMLDKPDATRAALEMLSNVSRRAPVAGALG